MNSIQIGQVFWVEMDAMIHGKRPVCVVAYQDGKVWLMPLTTRLDCMQRWDIVIEPSATNGIARTSKTSPDYTQVKPVSFLAGLTPAGKIDKATVKEMVAGYRIWKEASKSKKLSLKKVA